MIHVPYISHLAAALTRNKWGWVLSVTNLIITIAAFFAILVYVNWDLSHNRVWPDSHLIYRVASLDIPKSGPVSKNLLFPESQVSVLSNFIGDQASDLTAVGAMQATATINERDVVVPLQFVNQNFLDFFQLDTTQGDLDFALSTPGYIALEESMAKELFGSSSLAQINEPITLMGSSSLSIVDGVPTMLPGREVAFTVGAIYKLPSPITSATKFFALTLMHDFSQSLSAPASGTPFSLVSIWMKIDSPKDARQVENSLAGITGVFAGFSGEGQLFLEPLRDIYFQNRGDRTTESPAGDITRTTAIAIIGLMILVSGCSNTMSASMTDSLTQLRSIGVRRAFGGTRQHVFTLSFTTQIVLTAIALLPAIAITELLTDPIAKQLTSQTAVGEEGSLSYSMDLLSYLPHLLGVAILLSLANSYFPGIYLTRFRPARLLGNTTIFTKLDGLGARTFLVAFQFAASTFLISLVIVFTAQLGYFTKRDLGFDPNNLVWVSNGASQGVDIGPLIANIGEIPGVESVGEVASPPLAISISHFTEPPRLARTQSEEQGAQAAFRAIGYNFFRTAGVPLIAGREFSSQRDADSSDPTSTQSTPANIVLNEAAAQVLGFNSPEQAIGQFVYEQYTFNETFRYTPYNVIGVVKNESYFQVLEPATGAQAYRLNSSDSGRRGLLIRSDGSNPALLQDEIITAWSRLSGTEPSYTHIDDMIESSFSMETRVTKLLGVAALFTIVLSTIGMCGLVSSVLVSQSKFIAIRTVFGANSWSVMTLYCMRFSMPIFIAILVGCPAAVFLALEWIERFPYQLGKTTVSLIGLGAAALSMLLSWAVICILSMLILRRKPSELLRTE